MMGDIVCWKSEKFRISLEGYEFVPKPMLLLQKGDKNSEVSVMFYSSNYFEIHYSYNYMSAEFKGMIRIYYRGQNEKEIYEKLILHSIPKGLLISLADIFEYLRGSYPELYSCVQVADDYVKCILVGGVDV